MADKILVTAIEGARMLSMGRSTFWRAIGAGMLPQPVRIGGLSALVNQSSLTEGLLSTRSSHFGQRRPTTGLQRKSSLK